MVDPSFVLKHSGGSGAEIRDPSQIGPSIVVKLKEIRAEKCKIPLEERRQRRLEKIAREWFDFRQQLRRLVANPEEEKLWTENYRLETERWLHDFPEDDEMCRLETTDNIWLLHRCECCADLYNDPFDRDFCVRCEFECLPVNEELGISPYELTRALRRQG